MRTLIIAGRPVPLVHLRELAAAQRRTAPPGSDAAIVGLALEQLLDAQAHRRSPQAHHELECLVGLELCSSCAGHVLHILCREDPDVDRDPRPPVREGGAS